jgi:hypothetical protein
MRDGLPEQQPVLRSCVVSLLKSSSNARNVEAHEDRRGNNEAKGLGGPTHPRITPHYGTDRARVQGGVAVRGEWYPLYRSA